MNHSYFKKVVLASFILFLTTSQFVLYTQTKRDSLDINKTIRNFIEEWYEGNAERMANSLHEEVISKIVIPHNEGDKLGRFTAERLIELTKNGGGTQVPKNEQRKEIKILEIYQNVATARVLAYDAMEFLHLAKWQGEWKIINILFERTIK